MLERRITRRALFRGSAALVTAFGLTAGFPSPVYGPTVDSSGAFGSSPAAAAESLDRIAELGDRTIQEAVAACEARRAHFALNQRPRLSTLLTEALDTQLAQSQKLGLNNAHLWSESDGIFDWNVPFAFAVDPNGPPVDGRAIWFANMSTVDDFRTASLGDRIDHIANRTIWAMQKGSNSLAVVEIEDDEGVANLAKLTELLVKFGVRTIVIGNEFDNGRFVPQRLYNAAIIAQDTFLRLRVHGGNVLFPATDFNYKNYGQQTRQWYEDVIACGDARPFTGFSYHFYDIPENLPAWTRNQGGFTKDIEGMSHVLTEVGLPLAVLTSADYTSDKAWAGTTAKILTMAGASDFFARVYYHSLLDGENEKHSLARVSGENLAPNISHLVYQNVVRLFANPVGKPEIIAEKGVMGAYGRRQRNDGRQQKFAVVWSKNPQKDVMLSSDETVGEGARVYDVFGQPTGETDMVDLTSKYPKIILADAA